MTSNEHEYVLGTDDAELLRLGLQHRLWSAQAFACWERAGVKPGATVLDVGAGPGFATLDLAQLVTPSGRIIAIDESERFLRHLAERARVLGLSHVETRAQDVQALDVPAASVDVAYARWVLCFTPNPEDVVARVAAALKPGGAFAVQDYINWGALSVSPRSDAFLRVMPAVGKSWRDHGGDWHVGDRLPAMMARRGLRVESITPLQRVARSSDPLWQWPTTFFANFIPRLVEQGLVAEADWREMERDWQERSRDPNAFFWTPSMVEIIARRA
ncbi:MAG TPA: methyltransferase domain-containing protein [Candidatus Krumholzibacteria bacterium]|nr:methyltransferase domain-containing protein [Candidatus Krumholzibacteria bacterium]